MLTLTRFAAAFTMALAYLLVAPHLPALSGHDLNAFVSGAVGLLLCAGIVIAALPLRDDLRAIIAGLAVGGVAALALSAAGALEAASPFKAMFAAAAGYGLARFLFSPLIVYALAVGVAVGDAVSVSTGPTRYVLDEQPRVVESWRSTCRSGAGPTGRTSARATCCSSPSTSTAPGASGCAGGATPAPARVLRGSLAIAVWTDVAVRLCRCCRWLAGAELDLVWAVAVRVQRSRLTGRGPRGERRRRRREGALRVVRGTTHSGRDTARARGRQRLFPCARCAAEQVAVADEPEAP